MIVHNPHVLGVRSPSRPSSRSVKTGLLVEPEVALKTEKQVVVKQEAFCIRASERGVQGFEKQKGRAARGARKQEGASVARCEEEKDERRKT